MLRYIFMIILGLLLGQGLFAQNTKLDSLLLFLNAAKQDTQSVMTQVRIAKDLLKTNPDTVIYFAQKALKNAHNIGFKKGVANASELIGAALRVKGDFLNCLKYFFEAEHIYKALGDKPALAQLLNNIGVTYCQRGDFTQCQKYNLEALRLREALKDKKGIAASYMNIGILHQIQGDVSKAKEYYQKATPIYQELNDKSGLASNLITIGLLDVDKEEYEQALSKFQKALAIHESLADKNNIAIACNNIAKVLKAQNKLPEAIVYYKKGLEYHEATSNKDGMSYSLNGMALTYKEMKKLEEAQNHAAKALELAKQTGNKYYQQTSTAFLSEIYEDKKDFQKALSYYKEAIALKDSLFNMEKTKQINTLQANFDLEKKEKAIQLLEQEKNTQENKLQLKTLQNIIFAAVAVLLLIIVLLLYKYVRKKQKLNTLLSSQNQAMQAQTAQLKESAETIEIQNQQLALVNEQVFDYQTALIAQLSAIRRTLAYLEIDSSAHITEANTILLQALAYERNDILALSLKELIKIDTNEFEKIWTNLEKGVPQSVILFFASRFHKSIKIECSFSPIINKQKQLSKVILLGLVAKP